MGNELFSELQARNAAVADAEDVDASLHFSDDYTEHKDEGTEPVVEDDEGEVSAEDAADSGAEDAADSGAEDGVGVKDEADEADEVEVDDLDYEAEVESSHLGVDSNGFDLWMDTTKQEHVSDVAESSTPEKKLEPTTFPEGYRSQEAGNSVTDFLNVDEDDFSLEYKIINIDSIVISKPKKDSRKRSLKGLTGVVTEIGVLTPIHVMMTESFKDAVEEGTDEYYSGPRYTVLDGFRRIYAALGAGLREVPAVVWDFKDAEKGADISLVLSLLLSKTQRHTWGESWNLYRILEMQSAMSPAAIEYLLEMEPGQAMKLKDIALATNYPEIWNDLLDNKKTLDQSYNALNKLRKEEDQYAIEDAQGLGGLGEAGELAGDSTSGSGTVSEEEVREALELVDTEELDFVTGDEDDDELQEMFGHVDGDLQTTEGRKPLDPVLRAKVLARDEFACQCCDFGRGVTSTIAAMDLAIHHTHSIYLGEEGGASTDDLGMIYEGSDIPKLLTLCETCHRSLHNLTNAGGKMGVTKEEFDLLPEHEQKRWKNINKYARVLLAAQEKAGKKLKQVPSKPLPRKPFWESRDENLAAIQIEEALEERGNRDYSDVTYE